MAQKILVNNDGRQTFTTIIGNQKIRLLIYFLEDKVGNAKSGWFVNLNLLTTTEENIIEGDRLESGGQVAKNLVTEMIGSIFVVPLTTPSQDLTENNAWDKTHILVYFTPDEVAEIATLRS